VAQQLIRILVYYAQCLLGGFSVISLVSLGFGSRYLGGVCGTLGRAPLSMRLVGTWM
jgi:hypothetical protein